MKNEIFTLGAPRTGFTLLISIINELSRYKKTKEEKKSERLIADKVIDIASIYLKNEFFDFFQNRIDMKDYMYNGEFDLLVGGPKWINPENRQECVIRKYIGIKDQGDFTFLLYLPKSALNYDRVVHSHYYPQSWVDDTYYDTYVKLASVRNPMGVINSAVFSINAITSEYITKYIDDFDEDEFREIMALYKLTDLDLFDGLVRFLKGYLDEFIPVMDQFAVIKWEDIIDYPVETIQAIAKKVEVEINDEQAKEIWNRLDHRNLPKYHLFNFRKGHGIVGEWKQRLTNHHLAIFEKYGFNTYLKLLGYEEICYFNEENYTDFQKEVDRSIKKGEICNKITDDNLFKFCWNKSNISQTSHSFDRFERVGHSQVERSSLEDKRLATDFDEEVRPKIELVNAIIKDFENCVDFEAKRDHYFSLLCEKLSDEQQEEVKKHFDAIGTIMKKECSANTLELKLIETAVFDRALEELPHFKIVGDDEDAKRLAVTFAGKLDEASENIIITNDDPTEELQNYLDKCSGTVVAKRGKKYFKNKPLFLISIPKAGTHLLYELAKAFGYHEGGICPSNPKGGHWYFTEYSNSHTKAKHFFNETVYVSDFGNRDHPFATAPALFIYRNPLDIVASEANYYHKEGKTIFSGYLNRLSYDERLAKLINDPWLLGSIRDRVCDFIAWSCFENVVSLSFEELIGSAGGGSEKLQQQLLWSLQLKLQIPGRPAVFANQVFNKESATFFKGKIGSFKESFKEEHYRQFGELNQDFMQELGYSMNGESLFSSKIDSFRTKKLRYPYAIDFPPILREGDYHGYNIVKFLNVFYAVPIALGPIDLNDDALDVSVLKSADINGLKTAVLEKKIKKMMDRV